ncbi:MAG: TetR/AcrR family transcriptional regulator [Bacteroidetes bacterium]|nr:MAG: TetR/AcrR family transcriptional regulator [Bacteroidota bacterium]
MTSMDKKQKVMISARKLFAENGFYSTATAKIAKEAGVSNGILFHYFNTKDILIQELYNDLKDRLFKYTADQIYKGATLKESIYTLWLASLEWNMENPEDFVFMRQFENSHYFNEQIYGNHRFVQMSLELAEKGIDQGILKKVPPMLLVQTMSGMVETSVTYLKAHPENAANQDFKDRLFELAWDAIKK